MKKLLFLGICYLAVVSFPLSGCDHDGFRGSSDGGSSGLNISQNQLDPARLAGTQVTFEQAVQIAIAHSGGGTIVEMVWELSWNGQYIFEIEIRDTRGRKHEVKFDPATGSIISIKSKR